MPEPIKFPRADEKDQLAEWTICPQFLQKIKTQIKNKTLCSLSLDCIELILLSAEALNDQPKTE